MKLGGANEFPTIAKHSDAELLNITKESLDDKKPTRFWGHCTFPECKATTLCQRRWKADQVVITCIGIMSTTTKSSLDPTGVHKKK